MSWKRGIWLCILFCGGLLTAVSLRGYHSQLSRWAWLIPFLPMILSNGGNSGSQSSTLVITALTRGQITRKDWLRVASREIIVGGLLGLFLGFLGLIVAQLFGNSPGPIDAMVVPITLTLVVTVGTLIGSMLPI